MIPPAGAAPESASSTEPPQGVSAEAMRLFGSISRHLQALAGLAGEEGREAVTLYVRLAIVLAAGLFFAAFGYVFLLLFAAFAIASLAGIGWIWIALGFAVLHLLVVAACALHLKARYRTPVFRMTAQEIRNDIAGLRGPQP